MSSADQLLAQQANQTMALFQAIDRNTQQAFANRSAVQQMELQAGLKVSQLLEEQRMNDVRASAVRQSMSIQAQRFAAEKKLLPLVEKQKRMQAERQLMEEAKKVAGPELEPVNAMIRQEIERNPQMARGIRDVYENEFRNAINSDDPDFTASIPKMRDAVSKYISDQNMLQQGPPKPADKQAAMEAAMFAQSLGGNGNKLLYEHDPEFRQQVDDTVRYAKLTGKFDEKMLNMLPDNKREEIFNVMESQKRAKDLDSVEKELFSQYNLYKDALNQTGPIGEQARTQIERINRELESIGKERMRLSGVTSDQGGSPPPPDIPPNVLGAKAAFEATTGELPTSQEQLAIDESTEIERKVSAASPVVEQLISGDKKQWESLKQTMQQNPSLLYDPARAPQIFKELVNPTERQVLEAVKNPEFAKMIVSGDAGINRVLTPTGTRVQMTQPNPAAEAYYTLTNKSSSRDEQKRAINVLKPKLPELVLRYIQAR